MRLISRLWHGIFDQTYVTSNSTKDNSVVRVDLLKDPNFIDTMVKNGVDIVVIPVPR
jgi:hypothetical protein